jgi:VirK protein
LWCDVLLIYITTVVVAGAGAIPVAGGLLPWSRMMKFSPVSFRCTIFRIAYGLIGVGLMLAPVAATEVSTYADVLSALQSGKAVTVLTDLGRCTDPETGKAGPALQGGLRIQAFLAGVEKGLMFAGVHQTLDPSDQPVTEYIRYNLKPMAR